MTLPATDSFVAANGTVLTTYSTKWTAIKNNLVINTNAAAPGAFFDRCAAIWNDDVFANDQYSQAILTAIDGSGTVWTGVAARGTAGNYYGFNVTGGARELISYIAGAGTVLASDSVTCLVGDVLKLVIAGTLLTASVNGVSVFSVTNAGLAAGSAGLSAVGHFTGSVASRVSTWEGGNGSGGAPAGRVNPTAVIVPSLPFALLEVSDGRTSSHRREYRRRGTGGCDRQDRHSDQRARATAREGAARRLFL